ncbi:MAG: hypothetical protein AAF620_08600 [Bacteroidota bacterium]
MKISFEDWIDKKPFSENVKALFKEAVICYRNNTYRASLLFSYLAFLTIIKEVIIKSAAPTGINESRWSSIIRKLQNEKEWEATVFEEIINSSNPIFNMNEDLRQQVKYWKDRRNDCAHFKPNEIASHHTESFWSFVRSNLSKITVEGGKESLLNKFEIHFDPTFTPPNANFDSLITEIDDAVDSIDLNNFWDELIQRVDNFGIIFYHYSTINNVLNKVLELCSDSTKENLVNYLKGKNKDLVTVALFPDKIHYFNYSPTDIREIWRTRIWQHDQTAFTVYGTLLRNNLIPKNQITEAHQYIIDHGKERRPDDEATHYALAGSGFGDILFKIIKDNRLEDWYNWVQPRADMLAYYFEKYPLRDESVEIICEMYTRSRYSHWLGERLERLFVDQAGIKTEFHRIANDQGLEIPVRLQ